MSLDAIIPPFPTPCVITEPGLFKAGDHIHVGVRTCTIVHCTQERQESPAGTRQTDVKHLVWFGELERKLAKLSKTTFTYRSSS